MRGLLISIAFMAAFTGGGVCQGTKLPVQQAIEAQFPVTKPTADHKDIVTAGAVIDLLKDNLVMNAVTATKECGDTYKGGRFEPGTLCKMGGGTNGWLAGKMGIPSAGANRTFVAGEKFWLIKVDVQDKAAVLEFLSDAISDVRYRATVAYPYPSGTVPPPDVMVTMIKETIKAEPAEGGKEEAAKPASPPPPAAPAPPPAAKVEDFPPPPPPTDAPAAAPVTVSVGESLDALIASQGQPAKKLDRGVKGTVYVYPDMKVTVVKGKVTDVQ